jgi:hypothetical protein
LFYAEPANPGLRGDLLKMQEELNGSLRQARAAAGSDQRSARRVNEIDAANTRGMRKIVDEFGWPTISMVGTDGSDAAGMLVQRARDLPFMERCLKLMEPLSARGEVSKLDVAFLTDLVLVRRRLPQRYGTQGKQVGGDYVLDPIEDPEHVEARRAAMGLDTLAKDRERMRAFLAPPSTPQKPAP